MGVVKLTIQTSTKAVKLRKEFDPNVHTILNIKEEYCNTEDSSKTPAKMRLYKGKRELSNDGATLTQAGIKRSQALTLTFRVIGGALWQPNAKNILNSKRNRTFDANDPDITISKQPDCIYYYSDKDGIQRAEMPCKHAFAAPTMFDLLKNVITKNSYEYDIKCPMPNCKIVFDFDVCAAVADLNDDEYMFIQGELNKRAAPETQACPYCSSACERPESLKKFRVNCEGCDGGDWCFICCGKWIGGGFTVCGNSACQSATINHMLKTCPNKKATSGVIVPQIRACPKCLEFIEHDDACKHMKCPGCGHNFCFACLKPQLNGSWQCGSYSSPCAAAPRQTIK